MEIKNLRKDAAMAKWPQDRELAGKLHDLLEKARDATLDAATSGDIDASDRAIAELCEFGEHIAVVAHDPELRKMCAEYAAEGRKILARRLQNLD